MRYLALLLAGLVSLPAAALTKVNLYQTEVVLDQQNDESDDQARIQGMEQVIVRATGDKSSLDNDVVKKALQNNSRYLTQISSNDDNGQETMTLGFSEPHIRSLLTQAQLPFWPAYRSNVLVWLVEDKNYDRTIAWEHSDSVPLKTLVQDAKARGLPLTVPVGDFDDITGIETSDLWGDFTGPIAQASSRYPTDAVLVIRVQDDAINWTLYDQSGQQMMDDAKEPVTGQAAGEQAIDQVVNDVSQYFAKKNAVLISSQSSESVVADFSSIKNADEFFTLEKSLKSLSSVAALDIVSIQGNDVQYRVHLLATPENFEQEVLRTKLVDKIDTQTVPSGETVPDFGYVIGSGINAPQGTDTDNTAVVANNAQATPDATNASNNTETTSSSETEQGTTADNELAKVPSTLYFKWKE